MATTPPPSIFISPRRVRMPRLIGPTIPREVRRARALERLAERARLVAERALAKEKARADALVAKLADKEKAREATARRLAQTQRDLARLKGAQVWDTRANRLAALAQSGDPDGGAYVSAHTVRRHQRAAKKELDAAVAEADVSNVRL